MIVAMIDMKDVGNLQSISGAFRRVGVDVDLVSERQRIQRADAVILPGVGAFGKGMESLHRLKLVEGIREHALERRKPIIGICLGMQLMAREGEEHGLEQGLGLVDARVVRLPSGVPVCRIPNMGWCDVTVINPESKIFAGLRNVDTYYFAHSFHMQCADPRDVAATIGYGGPVVAAVEHENILGIQFHPEKSQESGLDLIDSFCRYVRNSAA